MLTVGRVCHHAYKEAHLVMWRGQVERERPNQTPVPHTITSRLGDKKIFPMGAAIRIELYESLQITTQLNLVNIQKYEIIINYCLKLDGLCTNRK